MKPFLFLIPLMISGGLLAQDHYDWHHVHDARHNDYHNWDAREDRAWHIYWEQRHQNYIAWERANERQRAEYWDWRHSHSDAVLNINIR